MYESHSSPALLERPDEMTDEKIPTTATFADLGLAPGLLQAVTEAGFDTPTPIQQQTIPSLLEGRDLLGQAQTGTGKTAAFGLPMLQRLDLRQAVVQGLVLAPTRELAMQVADALRALGKYLGQLRIATVYGGQPIYRQLEELSRGPHIVVGTPGRLIDCIERGALKLGNVRMAVLDEADEMLRMGFLEDVELILSKANAERQTALFSATLPGAIQRVARSYLRDPVSVTLGAGERSVAEIEQKVLIVQARHRLDALTRVLEAESGGATLVFARTKAGCATLAEALLERGFAAAALHGDMSQAQREDVVKQLRAGRIELVVATDVAARGLDVDGIGQVVNYDPPMDAETYLHRIGRTGRAGRTGIAVLIITPRERHLQRAFERYTRQVMKPMGVPTAVDIANCRTARFEAKVLEEIAAGELDGYQAIVQKMSAAHGVDPLLIAAAIARSVSKERSLVADASADVELVAAAPFAEASGPSLQRRPPPGRTARMFMSIGARNQLRPGDLVGALANGFAVPGRAIGAIEIRESVTLFDVLIDHEQDVLSASGRMVLRGQRVRITRARPESAEDRRPSHGRADDRRHGPRGRAEGGGDRRPNPSPWMRQNAGDDRPQRGDFRGRPSRPRR